METSRIEVVPHPQLLEALFAFRSKVLQVFRDVAGIYGINHLAITQIGLDHNIRILSSTPALEYNLFQSNLWQFDKTYCAKWFNQCSQSSWESLYSNKRYDELYYLKQIKPFYPIGRSFAARCEDHFYIYSMASQSDSEETREIFSNQYEDFYKIGQYCSNLLAPLFGQFNQLSTELLLIG